MEKYSHISKLSTDLVSPRPYPYTLKMSSFGWVNNSKKLDRIAPPPNQK